MTLACPMKLRTRAREPRLWLSFDDTVPVPALGKRYAVSRESLNDPFERRSSTDTIEVRRGQRLNPP
jgi:hypothetical protein